MGNSVKAELRTRTTPTSTTAIPMTLLQDAPSQLSQKAKNTPKSQRALLPSTHPGELPTLQTPPMTHFLTLPLSTTHLILKPKSRKSQRRTSALRSGSSQPTAPTSGDGPTSGSQLTEPMLATLSLLPSSRTSRAQASTDSTFTNSETSHGSARPPVPTTFQTVRELVNSRTTRPLEPHGEKK